MHIETPQTNSAVQVPSRLVNGWASRRSLAFVEPESRNVLRLRSLPRASFECINPKIKLIQSRECPQKPNCAKKDASRGVTYLQRISASTTLHPRYARLRRVTPSTFQLAMPHKHAARAAVESCARSAGYVKTAGSRLNRNHKPDVTAKVGIVSSDMKNGSARTESRPAGTTTTTDFGGRRTPELVVAKWCISAPFNGAFVARNGAYSLHLMVHIRTRSMY